MSSPRCPICPGKPARPPDEGRASCTPCRTGLDGMLAQISALASFLVLVPGSGITSSDTVRRPADGGPAPLRLDVLALTMPGGDLAVGPVLEAYARQVHGEGVHGSDGTVVGRLRANLEWIDAQPWLADFARDVRRLHAAVLRACGETTTRVGACQRVIGTRTREVIAEDGTRRKHEVAAECGGSILASFTNDEAVCSRCGDKWPRERWALLGKLQEAT